MQQNSQFYQVDKSSSIDESFQAAQARKKYQQQQFLKQKYLRQRQTMQNSAQQYQEQKSNDKILNSPYTSDPKHNQLSKDQQQNSQNFSCDQSGVKTIYYKEEDEQRIKKANIQRGNQSKFKQQEFSADQPSSRYLKQPNPQFFKNNESNNKILDQSISAYQFIQQILLTPQQKDALIKLGYQILNPQNKLKSQISLQSLLKYPKIFKQQPNNKWLFYLDHASKQGGSIRILDSNQEGTYNYGLKNSDKFLVYKIKTGKWTKYEELQRIFNNYFQSVSEYEFQKKWKQDGSNEHGFDFIKKPQNVKKLRKITLTGNRLSKKILPTDLFKLPSFSELELNFEENVPDQFLVQLMTLVASKPLDFNLKVILWDSRKQEDFEDGDLSANIGNQIELKYRQLKIKQVKPVLKQNQEKKAEQSPQQAPRKQLNPGTYVTGNTSTSGNITQYGSNVNGNNTGNVYHYK